MSKSPDVASRSGVLTKSPGKHFGDPRNRMRPGG